MFCQNCGSKILENATFCPNCGSKVDKPQEGTTQQSAPITGTRFTQPTVQPTVQSREVYTQPDTRPIAYGETGFSQQKRRTGWLNFVIVINWIEVVLLGFAAIMAMSPDDELVNDLEATKEDIRMAGFLLLGVAAFGLEIVKTYTLINFEYLIYLKKKQKAVRAFGLFFLLTILSIVASISFAQASIYSTIEEVQVVLERESVIQEQGNPLIDIKNILLDNKQAQLEMLNKRIEELPPDYVTSSIKLSDEVNKLNDDIYKISEEIAQLTIDSYQEKIETTTEMSSKKETFNRFYLLGKPLGMTETEALFVFLTLFAVLLELGIIATAPAPEKRSIKELIGNRITKHMEKTIKVNSIKNTAIKKHTAKVSIDVLQPNINAELSPIKKRGTAQQLLSELYDSSKNPYLKNPAQAAYINNRTVEEYLHIVNRLQKLRPSVGSAPLLSKEGDRFKMNYSFNYIKSTIKKQSKDIK